MEGYLQKWINLVYGWKLRYFIIHDGVMIYCNRKGQQKKGSISLKISSFSEIPEDPLRIVIDTGLSELHLRASSIEEKQRWLAAMRKGQRESDGKSSYDNLDDESQNSQSKGLYKSSKLNLLNDKLAEIWCCQAEFEESMSLLLSKMDRNKEVVELGDKVINYANDLKKKVTTCVHGIEEEKKRLMKQIQKTQNDQGNQFNRPLNNQNYSLNMQNEDKLDYDNQTEFQSFSDDEEEEEKIDQNEKTERIEAEKKIAQEQSRYIQLKNNNASFEGSLIKAETIISSYTLDPTKISLLTKNGTFVGIPFSSSPTRKQLPAFKDPNLKVNVWSILSGMINKDMTRISLPVYLNEPISMLQRLCEDNEYNDLLIKASTLDDSCLRMCYVVAWGISPYSATTGRLKKPFNPILGETFDYVPPDGSYKYIAEQVSHHPPVSAGFSESSTYKWWADTMVKTTFWGKSVEVTPQGSKHVILKKHNDHIIFRKPTSVAQNIIIGTMYVDHYGDISFTNHTTKDTALLSLTKQGWTSKGAFELNGWVKDRNGKLRYTLKGKWTEGLKVIDEFTKQEIVIWTKNKTIPNWAEQYCFTEFTLQMNYLPADLVVKLPATDTRFRPDQRALEHGNIDLAISEKFRLEEKQRARRKQLQANGQTHIPKWFKEIVDPITNDTAYEYIGGYWEYREHGTFENILDIYA